jgi:type I restriction enzyme R subunit
LAAGQVVPLREEYYYNDGRMNIQGRIALRGERAFVDYLLIYDHVPLAVVEAKDNNHAIGAGIQQALRYADFAGDGHGNG